MLLQTLSAAVTKDLTLDLLERAVVLALFINFVSHILGRLTHLVLLQIAHPELIIDAAATNIGAILLVVSEGLGVVLILLRRRSPTLSLRPSDWFLAFVAVNAPLLAAPAPPSTIVPWELASALMFAGMLIQIAAKATLWRSFGIVPANRGVKTSGPYRIVRHPMYAGYTITHIGFLVGFPLLQNSLLYLAVFLIELIRIMREEAILKKDPAYRAYAARVRYRLLPGVF